MKKYMVIALLSISVLAITSCSTTVEKPPIVEDSGSPTDVEPEVKPDIEEAPQGEKDIEIGIGPGMKAPDFTLKGREDEDITLSDYKGKVVFLNFWATTCPFCIAEMPDLEEFYNEHKDEDDFALIGINMTKTWEKKSKEKLVEWLDDEGLTFPVAFDIDGEQAVQWAARSLPVTFIIDQSGNSLGAIIGKTDKQTLENILVEVRAAQ